MQQKWLAFGSLLLSSAASFTLLTGTIPANFGWVKPVLTVLAASLSLWSLVAKNERASIDCSDLHFRWSSLALQYEMLWSNMYTEDAGNKLEQLRTEELSISKSSTSLPFTRHCWRRHSRTL